LTLTLPYHCTTSAHECPNVALVVVNVVHTVLMDVMNNLETSAIVGEEMSYFGEQKRRKPALVSRA
jgi:hypothetical protein